MIVIGRRRRAQPPPPHILIEALLDPDRDPTRPWLTLLDDEHRPRTMRAAGRERVEWSSLWSKRPDALIAFDVDADGGGGSYLTWTVSVTEPGPDDALVGHIRKRMNQLINGNLRRSFGQ